MRNHENHEPDYSKFRHRVAVTEDDIVPIRDLPGQIEIETDGSGESYEVSKAAHDLVVSMPNEAQPDIDKD